FYCKSTSSELPEPRSLLWVSAVVAPYEGVACAAELFVQDLVASLVVSSTAQLPSSNFFFRDFNHGGEQRSGRERA
ncbi:hypothetical protein, partial [Paraburkholderia tropica]|uniref:hypothetical protein n=1 Tax=Paraburkholderia tropica TaxID=92647 RepID=UPI001CC41AF2